MMNRESESSRREAEAAYERPGGAYDRPASVGGDVAWTDTHRTYAHFDGDVGALLADLRHHVRGEVRFDGGSRALYATDASNYRQVPIGVVVPLDADDVVEAVAGCRRHGAPVVARGGGTGLAGQCINAAVVIDCSKHVNRLLELDPEQRHAWVEPGLYLDHLRTPAEEHHLTFGPDPSTHAYCTFGGMIANNACGIHSQMAGCVESNVEELDVLLYDGTRMRVGPTSEEELEAIIRHGGRKGEIYERLRDLRDRYADVIRERYPHIPRRISGYNLSALLPENGFNVARALVGTEGTCVLFLKARVRLVHSPPHRVMVVFGYPSIYRAGDHVAEIGGFGPIGLEGLDSKLIQYMIEKQLHVEYLDLLPEGKGYLLAEFGADSREEAIEQAKRCMETIQESQGGDAPFMKLLEEKEEREQMLEIRESGLAATAHVRDETWPGWEDSAVPPDRIGGYLRELDDLYNKYHYEGSLYGHFGQGCIHTRINFDLRSKGGIEKYHAFLDEASDLCLKYGGSLSAEHGDGQARAELLPKMFGRELVEAFREFKQIWDPGWKLNPGKVVDPYRIDENLRLGGNYDPPELETHFAFPDDHFSFSKAAMRCVGVGTCRRLDMEKGEDTMCPSYLATHEEMHTTRGRARLLFEMLNGDETPDAWDNDDVKEALDLCLACKGCKTDCPVNVDMATYKAEFLSHYYEKNVPPRTAFSLGLIHWWARLASKAPGMANLLTQTPGISRVFKAVGGVAPERDLPPFAEETFKEWFFRRAVRNEGGPRVMLWPDTFNNYFKPHTARAAVEVLEAAGYQVVVPHATLCCGRPLYDYGFLGLAKHLWQDILTALKEDIRAGTPLVGLEPSCTAAFRDELTGLFPNDEDARRLQKQTFTLGEFLSNTEAYESPQIRRRALVHGHCHHKSIMGLEGERTVLDATGLDYEVLASSCCGMAGSFGYEAGEKYEVSLKCGEYALLPAVREADPDVLIVTDGFSCRQQIGQLTDRRALHLSELLHMGLRDEIESDAYPERRYLARMGDPEMRTRDGRPGAGLVAMAGFLLAGAVTLFLSRR